MTVTQKTDEEIKLDKTNRIMNTIAERASYYRENPQRFVEEFLGLHLKLFQKILIYAMMHYDYFLYIASRGQGKTWLCALFCVVRCILYPESKIICCSATFKQGKEILLKIQDDFMQKSPLLRNEILKCNIGQNDASIYFKNGSWIRLVVASDNARGARANILLVDEFRMVTQNIMSTVLRPMLSAPRTPAYLLKPEYAHLKEMNKELYISSAWFQASEIYEKVKSYTANFLDSNLNYFICSLPYQLSIQENLLMRQAIENEMSEADFSDITFFMERGAMFYGSGADSLFNFKVINERRVIQDSFHHLDYYKDNNIKIPVKEKGEIRILSVDIALLASKKHDNDASAIIINRAMPTSGQEYVSNIVYIETQEGLVTEELGMLIMRYYYQYKIDYLILDAGGVGQAILDYCMQDRYDTVYGEQYAALNCCNNDDLATRCKVRNAPKVIYAIKASASSNTKMCLALRNGFQNGNINLLIQETNIEEKLAKSVKGYNKLTNFQQGKLKLPYLQTSYLINEIINLEYETVGKEIKVKEKSGMRKDRYSSLEYSYYVTQQLALKLKPKKVTGKSLANKLPVHSYSRHTYF